MSNERIIHPLKPVYDASSKVLILGSFPSVKSREEGFYYANKTNRFWKILEEIYDEKIEDREEFSHKHHIALWDVIESCKIHGSSDSSITEVKVNDIFSLVKDTQIKVIFTTGQKASTIYDKYILDVHVPHISLPSSSSANASMKLQDLINKYYVIKEYTDEKY